MGDALGELVGAVLQLGVAMLIAAFFWAGHRALSALREKTHQPFTEWLGLVRPTAAMKDRVILLAGLAGFALLMNGLEWLLGLDVALKAMLKEVPVASLAQLEPAPAALIAGLSYAFIRTGGAEEVLVRGLLYRRLIGWFGGWPANIIQSLLFALLHNGIVLLLNPDAPALLHVDFFVRIFVSSLAVGWFMEKRDGGSLVMPWLAHSGANLLTFLSFWL